MSTVVLKDIFEHMNEMLKPLFVLLVETPNLWTVNIEHAPDFSVNMNGHNDL